MSYLFMLRTDILSDNGGYFQRVAQIRFYESNLAGVSEHIFFTFFKCMTYETCTKSYVSHLIQ